MDTLLWSLEETARQLGGVSTRTVRRMIDSGELSSVKVRKSLRVVASSIDAWLDNNMSNSHNNTRMLAGERKQPGGKRSCPLNVPTPRTGGSLSQIRAVKELDALLKQPTAKKQSL